MPYSEVIVLVERLEGFRRAVAARYVVDLVRSERASLGQFLSIRFQPNFRSAMVDLPCVQLGAFPHDVSLPSRLLTYESLELNLRNCSASPSRLREIAELTGRGLKVPVVSLQAEEAPAHFGWLAMFAGYDMPALSALTQTKLRWKPPGPGLIADLESMRYF